MWSTQANLSTPFTGLGVSITGNELVSQTMPITGVA